jgi:SHS2 domain-containing protein
MGFREIPHTADVALEVWAPDLVGLFAEAARGFNAVSGTQIASAPRVLRKVELGGIDEESLLVAYLTELVYAQEQDQLGFDEFNLRIEGQRLSGELAGARLISLTKPIKAITYHNLRINRTSRGYEVQIVFDV